MQPSEYAQWYYLIYLLPGGLALLLLLLSAVGGGHHHTGVGHGHHFGLHGHHVGAHGHHIGAHGHTAAHGQPGHASGHGPRAAGHTASPARPWLTFFGVGRAPLPLVWGSALLGWGVFGFWGTQLWESALHLPALFALPALGTAFAGALLTCRLTVALTTRLLPAEASSATSTVELCGRTGTVAYPVDETRGRVHVYDAFGTLHDTVARAAPGHGPIPRGRTVLVTDYDAARDQLIVEEIA